MHTNHNLNDLGMQKMVGDLFTTVRSQPEVAMNMRIEPDLILQDISEEEFKQAVDAVIVKRCPHGDCLCVVDSSIEKFYSIYHRECPLTIAPNMNGLVESRTFWHDSKRFRNGLYDFCLPETKEQTLMPVFYPAKQLNVNRVSQIPSNDPAPISLMAQYLYDQMEERAKVRTSVEGAGTNNGHSERESRPQNAHKGKITAWNKQGIVQKKQKKSVGSRVMGYLRRLCCCVGKNGDE